MAQVFLIREISVGGGIGQRQSFIDYDEKTGLVIRPDERLTDVGRAEWDRIMKVLAGAKGGDIRHIVDGPGLLDHCLKLQHVKRC